MELRINPNELKAITECLTKLKQTFKTVTADPQLLSFVGQLLVSRGKQNLQDGGPDARPYTALRPSTLKQKTRLGYSAKPLQRTGLMKRSLSYEVAGNLTLTGLNIIKHHQWGAPRAGIVARPVFTIETDDEEEIKDFLIRRFKQLNPNLQ